MIHAGLGGNRLTLVVTLVLQVPTDTARSPMSGWDSHMGKALCHGSSLPCSARPAYSSHPLISGGYVFLVASTECWDTVRRPFKVIPSHQVSSVGLDMQGTGVEFLEGSVDIIDFVVVQSDHNIPKTHRSGSSCFTWTRGFLFNGVSGCQQPSH